MLPEALPLRGWNIAALASAPIVLALAWVGVQRPLIGRLGLPASVSAGGAAAALGLVITMLAALVWLTNPFAAALLVPAAHGWLLAAAPGTQTSSRTRVVLVVLGLVLPLLMVVHYGLALDLGPLDLAWLAVLITAGGHVTPLAALFLSVLAGCFVGVVAVVRTRRRIVQNAEPDPITTRGPLGYAGPGSLGGHRVGAATIEVMRRALKPLSSVLLVVGTLLLIDAVVTLVWQEPVSALYSKIEQGRLGDDLAKLEDTEPTATDRKVLSRLGTLDRKLAYAARTLNRRTDDGQPLGRIRMRTIGVDRWSWRAPTPRACGAGPATTRARRCRARAARSPSPGTARPTARRSASSTSSSTATASRSRCRTGASSTRSSGSGSCRRRRRGSRSGCATTGSC